MKFKYFALILILTIIFSFGTVTASEIDDAIYLDDASLSAYALDSHDIMTDFSAESGDAQGTVSGLASDDVQGAVSSLDSESNELSDNENLNEGIADNKASNVKNLIKDGPVASDEDGIDLSVDMRLGETQTHILGFNNISFDIPLIISLSVDKGIAHNVKVHSLIPDDFEFVSYDSTVGVYDSSSGIWEVGDVDSSNNETLTIYTKLNKRGNFEILVNATTDSNDVNLQNNDLKCTIKANLKVTSNTTRTSSEQGGAQHENPSGSQDQGGFIDTKVDDRTDAGNDDGSNKENKPGKNIDTGSHTNSSRGGSSSGANSSGGGSSSGANSSGGSHSNSLSGNGDSDSNQGNNLEKSIDSSIFNKATSYLSDSIDNLFNIGSTSNDGVSDDSLETVEAKSVYDYRQIPILIFALFLLGLAGIFAYDKIKS